jgi:hypothetical protein
VRVRVGESKPLKTPYPFSKGIRVWKNIGKQIAVGLVTQISNETTL